MQLPSFATTPIFAARADFAATYSDVEQSESESFALLRTSFVGGDPRFSCHGGFRIIMSVAGEGLRYVGDNVAEFESPSIVIIGPDLPCMMKTTDTRTNFQTMVIAFSERILQGSLNEAPEFQAISRMLAQARRGLQIGKRTVDETVDKVIHLEKVTGFSRLIGLLNLLQIFANAEDSEIIATPAFELKSPFDDDHRLSQIYAYIHRHIREPITREQCARVASMSPSSFSRYFKSRAGVSLPYYLNELRISYACESLATSTLPISEVASQNGFGSVTSFNRVFQFSKKLSPTEYRRQIRRSSDS